MISPTTQLFPELPSVSWQQLRETCYQFLDCMEAKKLKSWRESHHKLIYDILIMSMQHQNILSQDTEAQQFSIGKSSLNTLESKFKH